MRRTTVYLPDDLKAALERRAAAEGRSEATLIREAIAARLKRPASPRIPLFASGDATLAERVDEELKDFGTS